MLFLAMIVNSLMTLIWLVLAASKEGNVKHYILFLVSAAGALWALQLNDAAVATGRVNGLSVAVVLSLAAFNGWMLIKHPSNR